MPKVGIAVSTRVGGLFGDTIATPGRYDLDESGFAFDYLEVGAVQRFGAHVGVEAALLADLSGVTLDHAALSVDHLPAELAIRGGLLRSRVGFESARSPWEVSLPDQSPALARVFGPLGHTFVGADLAVEIPAPWTLRPFVAASSATGPGMRSFYGDEQVPVDGLRDLAWQIGVENTFRTNPLTIDLEFAAVLGPNHTGRNNSSDVFAIALGLSYPEEGHPVGVKVETEWFVRRRQVPGDNLVDTSGWLLVAVDFAKDWQAAVRWDFAQKREASVLDAGDADDLLRTTLLVGYEPAPYVSLDLATGIESGGAHDEVGYSVQLVARVGFLPEESPR